MTNIRGQILIQGLGAFLGLLLLFFSFVIWGVHVVRQMQLDTAAQATALSAARAQAQLLNDSASHNLAVNFFVNASFNGFGAMQKDAVDLFKVWLKEQDWEQKSRWVQSGFLGYPVGVGQVVARLNGSDRGYQHYPIKMDLQLVLKDLYVIFLEGDIPVGGDWFEDVYFVRTWRENARKAQPTHTTTWLVCHGKMTSTASARVYLDVKEDEPFQNGGFPRLEENWKGSIEIQSLYPQFNALLMRTRPESHIIEAMHKLGG